MMLHNNPMLSRRGPRIILVIFFLCCCAVPLEAFWISVSPSSAPASLSHRRTVPCVLPPRLDGESSDAYFDRLTRAAADPQSFEQLALDNGEDETSVAAEQQQPERNYVPVEEWDAAQKNSTIGSMSWEERVQFEGQRNGNRFRQNEILRQNLKGF